MAILLSRVLSPAPLLYSIVLMTQFAYGAYLGAQFEFPPAVTLLYTVGLLWVTGWWLETDSRRGRVLQIYDLGFFLYVAWPIVMPYYLVKTRGVKGLLLILAFVAAYVGAGVVGVLLSVLVLTTRS